MTLKWLLNNSWPILLCNRKWGACIRESCSSRNIDLERVFVILQLVWDWAATTAQVSYHTSCLIKNQENIHYLTFCISGAFRYFQMYVFVCSKTYTFYLEIIATEKLLWNVNWKILMIDKRNLSFYCILS